MEPHWACGVRFLVLGEIPFHSLQRLDHQIPGTSPKHQSTANPRMAATKHDDHDLDTLGFRIVSFLAFGIGLARDLEYALVALPHCIRAASLKK